MTKSVVTLHICSEEDEINRCIGVLDDILDLYDADDFDDAELYRSTEPVSDASSSHLLPLKSCARTAVRNLEIRKSMSTGLSVISSSLGFIAFCVCYCV